MNLSKWFSLFSFLLISSWSFSQNGTTMEEYRYLTKGYPYQLDMGLDAEKEGYTIVKLYQSDEDVQFVGLYKNGQGQLKGLLAIINASQAKPKYLCIPNQQANEEINTLYKKQKQNVLADYTTREQYDLAMTDLLLKSIDQPMQALPHSGRQEELTSKGSTVSPKIKLTSKGIPLNQQPSYRQNQLSERSITPETELPTEMNNIVIPKGEQNRMVEANIGGNLMDRKLLQEPIIFGKHNSKGRVVIKVCVDGTGKVYSAKFTQKGSTTFDPKLKKMALESTRLVQFQPGDFIEQCGIIAYHFK